jgi:hypothetical protein
MMTWTLEQLAAGVAALPAGTSNADAASVLAAQKTTLTNQVFTVHDAKVIALTSPNASWARIKLRSQQTPTGTNAIVDAAILAALTITETSEAQVVDPTTAYYVAWTVGLAALHAAGDLSADDVAAIQELTVKTVPTWTPTPTADDVAAAIAPPVAPVTPAIITPGE